MEDVSDFLQKKAVQETEESYRTTGHSQTTNYKVRKSAFACSPVHFHWEDTADLVKEFSTVKMQKRRESHQCLMSELCKLHTQNLFATVSKVCQPLHLDVTTVFQTAIRQTSFHLYLDCY